MKTYKFQALCVCLLAGMMITSCKKDDPTLVEPPHWQVTPAEGKAPQWVLPVVGDQPSSMTLYSSSFPDEVINTEGEVAAITLSGECIGITSVKEGDNIYMYIQKPTTDETAFFLCFYSAEQKQYFTAIPETGTFEFDNDVQLGKPSAPLALRWINTGSHPYANLLTTTITHCAAINEADEMAVFAGDECRIVANLSDKDYLVADAAKQTITVITFVPMDKLVETVEVRFYNATQKKVISQTANLKVGNSSRITIEQAQ